jgi:general secretion pathway protein L
MHVLSIDVGTYSVKFLSSFVDKRKITHVDMSEIILRDYLVDHPETSILQAQINIIEEILENNKRFDTKVIFQADNELITTRFLTLPTKSKKQAEKMLPFQLEEDIPYPLSDMHYAYRMEKQKTQHTALVELVRESVFETYFSILSERGILPNILCSEASVVENFFNQNPIAGPFCMLNIGHRKTHAYFFYNSRLIVTHVSYVGGQHVNDMISETYKIEMDEAIIYKHQNAFFLTTSQYPEVEPSQREFATAMDKVFAPLITDFTRWKIGFKVNYGLNIQNVFLCGGSANIKNIANYLTEKWEVKAALLESFDTTENEKIDLHAKNKSKFVLANMMAQGFRKKNRFINLLTGKFAQSSSSELPLHSYAFIGVRVVAATLLISISLMAERLFINRDINFVNARINSLMKNDELQVSGRIRRSVINTPRPVLDALVKRERSVKQEISTLQSAVEIQSLTPLVILSQIAASSKATLTDFKSTDTGEMSATFLSENNEDLSGLKDLLERSSLSEVQVTIDNTSHHLNLKATAN